MKNIITHVAGTLSNENLVLDTSVGSLANLGYDDQAAITAMGNKIGEAVFLEVNTYKTDLLPMMRKFIDGSSAKVSEYTERNPGEIYNVIEVEKHVLISELEKLNILPSEFNLISIPKLEVTLEVPEDIVSIIDHDDNIVKTMITNIAGKYDKEYINTLFKNTFGYMSDSNDRLTNLFYAGQDDVDDLALVYGIGKGILKSKSINGNEIPEGYLGLINNVVTNMLISLAKLSKSISTETANGIIFYGIKPVDGGYFNITVNKENYTSFAEEGGTVETLLGFVINNNFITENRTKDYLLSNKSTLEQLWNSHLQTSVINSKFDMIHKIRTIYSIVLTDIIKDVPDTLKSIFVSNVTEANTILLKILDTMVAVDTLDRETVGIKLFSALSHNTKFGKYINSMLELSKMNPDLTSQQCASLATCDLIIDYLSEQVGISRLDIGTGSLEPMVFKG